jgi:hypothetical protein
MKIVVLVYLKWTLLNHEENTNTIRITGKIAVSRNMIIKLKKS